jgi:pimeloyl-ACP methyl ester carboxylesterase
MVSSAVPPVSVQSGRGEVWSTLPATPSLPPGGRQGTISVDGVKIFYARYGHGTPVILLHGGLGNANYWGNQIAALAGQYDVIAIDLRGHGRSTTTDAPMHYQHLAADVLSVMDGLGIRRAALVGWSDGAIIGLSLAMTSPDRVERLFAFGANYDTRGLIAGGSHAPVFARYTARTAAEYRALSPRPDGYQHLVQRMTQMWSAEPHFSPGALASIRVPVAIADGDRDEIIRPEHTRDLAAAIRGASLIIEPGVSHFAMLQDPDRFNADLLQFLAGR